MNCSALLPQLAIDAVMSPAIAARVNALSGSSSISGRVSCIQVYFGPSVCGQ